MASKDTKRIVKVTEVERRRSSVYGNPSWTIIGEHESFAMQSDASDSYRITEHNLIGRTLELTLTPAGKVRYFKIIEEGV